jgi:MFS family permease
MTSLISRRIQAAVLSAALLLPAATAFGNDWSKPRSRTRGTAIGAAAGAVLGPPGAVVGAAVGNGVQYVRSKQHHRRHYRYRR